MDINKAEVIKPAIDLAKVLSELKQQFESEEALSYISIFPFINSYKNKKKIPLTVYTVKEKNYANSASNPILKMISQQR